MSAPSDSPGVYARQPDGRVVQVHAYQEGAYALTDIAELFALGQAGVTDDGRPALTLGETEVRQLKAMADAYSFDYEEGLIELCLDLHRFAAGMAENNFLFWSDF